MEDTDFYGESDDSGFNREFLEFLKLFARINYNKKLFPKSCRTCGKTFERLADYVCMTIPKRHSLQDCRAVMGMPFTMMYRHCTCGNTLVLTFTEESYPSLDDLWTMLRKESVDSGKKLEDVTEDFVDQLELFMSGLCEAERLQPMERVRAEPDGP